MSRAQRSVAPFARASPRRRARARLGGTSRAGARGGRSRRALVLAAATGSTARVCSLVVATMAPGSASSPSREASGLVAAAVSPLLGAVGLFLWGGVWTGDAYALNLVKCSVGSLGFVLVGALARGDGWLAALTLDALRWLVASALVGIVVGDNLWLRALRILGARRVILVDVLKPFVAAALARVELGEGVSLGIVVGMAVTMGGVLAVALERENADGRRGREKGEGGWWRGPGGWWRGPGGWWRGGGWWGGGMMGRGDGGEEGRGGGEWRGGAPP